MKRILAPLTAAIVLTGLFSCTEALENTSASSPAGPAETAAQDIPDTGNVTELILQFDAPTAERLLRFSDQDRLEPGQIREAFPETRAEAPAIASLLCLERVFPDAGEWEDRHREAGLHRFYKATLKEGRPATRAAEELGRIPGVVGTERIPRIKRCAVPVPFNDPYAKRYQWHLINDGSLHKAFVPGCDINVVPVWENYGAGSPEVIVSVVDDGIYYEHPDLQGVVIPAGQDGSKNFVNASSSGVPYDPYKIVPGDHGTHVAGIIGAVNNNGTGACGIAGGANGRGGVRLLSCQIFQDNPKDPDHPFGGNTAEAIVWGADHGAVISQNSWGYEYDNENQARYGRTPQSMKNAIDYFRTYAGIDKNGNQTGPMRGGVVIFAAGNDGWAYGQPADYEPVIAVGATGPDGLKAGYSNYGEWVDLCAPGGEFGRINAGGLSYIMSLATKGSNEYVWMCGTSMACPMVSGVAALAVSILGGPGFTNEMLEEMLIGGANPAIIPAEDGVGPMVDAFQTIDRNIREKVFFDTDYDEDYTIPTGHPLTVSYQVTDKAGNRFFISLSGDESVRMSESTANSCTLAFDASEEYVGAHTARLTARRVDGSVGNLDIHYTIYVNQAPELRCEFPDEVELKWFETLDIPVTAVDPEGRKDLVWTIRCTPEGIASLNAEGTGARLTLGNGHGDWSGSGQVTLTVRDPVGAETSATHSFSILPNRAPVTAKPFADLLLSGLGDRSTLSVGDYFTDPDGETLTFSFENSDERVANVSSGGGNFFIRSSQDGVSEVTVTARDGLGKTCSASFKVGVYDDKKGPTAYPNPVRDYLNIRIGAQKEVQVRMFSEMGECVLDQRGTASIFQQMKLDLRTLAPGRYKTTITIDGVSHEKQIVKL